jgi:uncharacterized iron-regulated protein
MNKIILSDIEKSKEIYPIVLNEIRKYGKNMFDMSMDDFLNTSESSDDKNFKKLLIKLHEITKKDIVLIDSYIDGWDTDWTEKDFQDLSFRISLPEPRTVENISQEEICEIYKIAKEENYKVNANDSIERRFFRYLNDYFEKLLEINLQYLL